VLFYNWYLNSLAVNCVVVQVREKLQESMKVDMREYRALINEEMLIVMRQMDSASRILSYLYLGSEWNASDLDELQENRLLSDQTDSHFIIIIWFFIFISQ